MKILRIAALAAAGLMLPQAAFAGEAEYVEMVAAHARANGVPEALVHRVIMRESRYQPGLIGRGGTIGLMQIKLATARGVGYTGDAAGLRDPNTNLTYAVKYLAGAYRAANGDHARAVRYFAGGYYYVAKRQRQEMVQQASNETWLEPNGNPQPMFGTPHKKLAQDVRNARAQAPK
ncbi:soluble lytic murein transglycosylase-like protein [Bradyrhizobium japonicum]|jgi:soluble lytic murein transglycosylase-like protein|uniref:lytic transglycosylase domain-containing protein n=1 Tax=Bradyrhizobium TaxID=374 RepID=UPI0004248288|nr:MULTISPECIES: lytic transglycosylase domain-containing protein [Bradyrhizobium]MBR0881434.1 lytic transglycosylase domain-containing protein [Bradyrhizobium liaoningense]MBR0947545.1 lytic transglycosylase domain-containing protein [Bradyrhizobium liaoningense]MBR0996701.1 lytic transglycosylase domain-containing protein [Bradyrhizobium liaoningense]MBR1026878.1 lytic transglycosylase domain-containing protein [Bradyrhizobium liaoningense]MBR1070277.1 lytic transglycosylase domain-containin